MTKPYALLRAQMPLAAQARAAQKAEAMMPDTTTPGERAYVAYVRVRYGLPEADAALTYTRSIPEERAAWETAAQAVLVAAGSFRFAVGQWVTWDEAPGAVWQVIERRQHEGPARTWRTYDLLPAAGDLTDFRPLCAPETQLKAAEE